MKYSEGDVLVRLCDEFTVCGTVGPIYIGINERGSALCMAEGELDDFTLTTAEPELVEVTMEEIAKLKGIPVELLRVKE